MEKEKKCCITIKCKDVLTTVTLIIAFVALFVSLSKSGCYNVFGEIIGVLTILVTVLIGWQIYKVISIDKTIKRDIKKAKRDLRIEITSSIKETEENLKRDAQVTKIDILITILRCSIRTKNQEMAFSVGAYAFDEILCYYKAYNSMDDGIKKRLDAALDVLIGKIEDGGFDTKAKKQTFDEINGPLYEIIPISPAKCNKLIKLLEEYYPK